MCAKPGPHKGNTSPVPMCTINMLFKVLIIIERALSRKTKFALKLFAIKFHISSLEVVEQVLY